MLPFQKPLGEQRRTKWREEKHGEEMRNGLRPTPESCHAVTPSHQTTTRWSDFQLKWTNQMVRLRLTRPILQCGLGRTGNTVFKIQRRAAESDYKSITHHVKWVTIITRTRALVMFFHVYHFLCIKCYTERQSAAYNLLKFWQHLLKMSTLFNKQDKT